MDNTAIHRCRNVKDFIETPNVRLITRKIPAYSQNRIWINGAELSRIARFLPCHYELTEK